MSARARFADGARGLAERPYATAAVAVLAVVVYLVVWGQGYGLDLAVYRDGVDAWASGRNPYQLRFGSGTRADVTEAVPPAWTLATLLARSVTCSRAGGGSLRQHPARAR